MYYGKTAWINANLPKEEVLELLRNDKWNENNIKGFVDFWSNVIHITIKKMDERIESVFKGVLTNPNPTQDEIKEALKTKSSRWRNELKYKISPIIYEYRKKQNRSDLHREFQEELKKVKLGGAVYTPWCHYLLDPKNYPPIDRFNYTAYMFLTQNKEMKKDVPGKFSNILGDDYTNFKNWFIEKVQKYKENENYEVKDIVKVDKALMSFGSFIISNK